MPNGAGKKQKVRSICSFMGAFLYNAYCEKSCTGKEFLFMQEHCMEEREVDFYARKLFITPKYLTEVSKKHKPQFYRNCRHA
jgi:hypothetical protein